MLKPLLSGKIDERSSADDFSRTNIHTEMAGRRIKGHYFKPMWAYEASNLFEGKAFCLITAKVQRLAANMVLT